MKYKGAELKEMDTKNINWTFYETPRKLLVWDTNDPEPTEAEVLAIMPERADGYQVITSTRAYGHCAEIPEEPKLATVRQLAQWVRKNGEVRYEFLPMGTVIITSDLHYEPGEEDKKVSCMEKRKFHATKVYVRKWEDAEWHAPTREYLGLED